MAGVFLYLTTVGRTTGAERQIEIWFVEREQRYYMISEGREAAGWVKNLLKQPRVAFSVGTRSDRASVLVRRAATARVIPDDDELARPVKALMDAKYGWSDGLIVELTPV
jgi:deazaflavin-dependent oxidoreductase (nitroreductase family)